MSSDTLDFLAANLAVPPFHQWLKPEIVSVDETAGTVQMRLPVRDDFRRHPERPHVHGGIIAALADMAGHAAIAAKLRHGVPTIDMRVDYLRLAAGEFLLASAVIIKLGRSIGVADVRITDDAGQLVAIGRAAYSTREG